jgi:hypothetical protein
LRAEEDRWDRESGTNWSRWEIRPWQNLDGVPGGILIFSEDITRRKHMEEALRESEFFSTPLPKPFMELLSNTDVPSATKPASALWDTSTWTKCSARICMT